MNTFTQLHPIPIEALLCQLRKYPTLSTDDKISFLDYLMANHDLLSMTIDAQIAFFRVRNIEIGQDITSIHDVLWPRGQQAANRLGPVFYIANTDMTAFAETEMKRAGHGMSQQVALVRFRITKPLRICPIGELDYLVRSGHGYRTFGDDANRLFKLLNEYLLQDYYGAQSFMLQDSFLFEQMICEERDVTSFIAKRIFQTNPSFDAIGYPSVRLRGGYNYAVKIDGFWRHWEVCAISKLHVECLHSGYYDFHPLAHVTKIDTDGTLHWKEDDDSAQKRWFQVPAFTLTP